MRILLIEDGDEYAENLISDMSDRYIIDVAYSGVEGTYLSQVNDYDAILVDSTLPDMDGVDVCREARSADVNAPILFVTDNDNLDYMLSSLDSGADAYISKPINSLELNSKLRALIRRTSNLIAKDRIELGGVCVNLKARQVEVYSEPIPLRRKEYDLLEYLAMHKDRAVSKEELLEHIWDEGINIFSNTVEVHIKHLRDKIEKPLGSRVIHTVRGFGYKLSYTVEKTPKNN